MKISKKVIEEAVRNALKEQREISIPTATGGEVYLQSLDGVSIDLGIIGEDGARAGVELSKEDAVKLIRGLQATMKRV